MKTLILITALLTGIIFLSISGNNLHATSVGTKNSTSNNDDSSLRDTSCIRMEIKKEPASKKLPDHSNTGTSGKHMTNIFIIL